MSRTFSDIMSTAAEREFPAMNVWANGDEAMVTMEVPGMAPESVDISVAGKTLTVRGSREPEKAQEGESCHRSERWYGSFSRVIEMPYLIDQNKVHARFSKGVLQIALPRAEADKPKKITVVSE
jgi:HSP20 family protein